MARKLYVGNLPYAVTSELLKTAFSQYGIVESVNLIADQYTGDCKGFGFVEMSSTAEAARAMQSLNGSSLDGKNITVTIAKPKAKGGRRSRR